MKPPTNTPVENLIKYKTIKLLIWTIPANKIATALKQSKNYLF